MMREVNSAGGLCEKSDQTAAVGVERMSRGNRRLKVVCPVTARLEVIVSGQILSGQGPTHV